jgi:FKBP12-rapamycin complex-associated protein
MCSETSHSFSLRESYSRAYSVVVRSQQLAELEEVMTYKRSVHDEEKRQLIRQLWRSR